MGFDPIDCPGHFPTEGSLEQIVCPGDLLKNSIRQKKVHVGRVREHQSWRYCSVLGPDTTSYNAKWWTIDWRRMAQRAGGFNN